MTVISRALTLTSFAADNPWSLCRNSQRTSASVASTNRLAQSVVEARPRGASDQTNERVLWTTSEATGCIQTSIGDRHTAKLHRTGDVRRNKRLNPQQVGRRSADYR